jgi:hypothetical protein
MVVQWLGIRALVPGNLRFGNIGLDIEFNFYE